MDNNNTTTKFRRNARDFADQTLLLKWTLPIKFIVGVGLIISTILPSSEYALIAGLLLMSSTVVKSVLARLHIYTDPVSKLVLKGRYQSRYQRSLIEEGNSSTNGNNNDDDDDGSFVVFLIGARPNRNIDSFFKFMGDSMEAMITELEDNDTLGYIGSESFVGTTGTLIVQWWKDVESLNAWASSTMRSHHGPWAKLAKMGMKSTDYGFWHETYKVEARNYESIYVNCPPMMFGNCKGVKLEPAMKTAAERMRQKKKKN